MSRLRTASRSPVDRPPGVTRAVALVVAYLAFYLLVGYVVSRVAGVRLTIGQLLASPRNILVGLVIPIGIAALTLVLFAAAIGWLRPLLARQPVGGSGWMWVAPTLVVLSVLLRLPDIDLAAFPASSVLLLGLAGLFVGVAEELLARGFVVRLLRMAGRPERFVMVVSSVLFALMHAVNLLSGQTIGATAVQLVFAFGFGACMFLTLRVTRRLVFPMLLHAVYDPTLFLSTGGAGSVRGSSVGVLTDLAAGVTVLFLVTAAVAVVLVRDRVPVE